MTAALLILIYTLVSTDGEFTDCHAVWSLVHVLLNLYRIFTQYYRLWSAERQYRVEDVHLARTYFKKFSRMQFMELWHKYEWVLKTEGDCLMEEGKPVEYLYLLWAGEAAIERGEMIIASVSRGQYLGEMAFFTGENASATVRCEQNCQLLRFPLQEIRKLQHSHDHSVKAQAFAMLPSLFCKDMAEKIMENHDAEKNKIVERLNAIRPARMTTASGRLNRAGKRLSTLL
eukprot:g2997.t1